MLRSIFFFTLLLVNVLFAAGSVVYREGGPLEVASQLVAARCIPKGTSYFQELHKYLASAPVLPARSQKPSSTFMECVVGLGLPARLSDKLIGCRTVDTRGLEKYLSSVPQDVLKQCEGFSSSVKYELLLRKIKADRAALRGKSDVVPPHARETDQCLNGCQEALIALQGRHAELQEQLKRAEWSLESACRKRKIEQEAVWKLLYQNRPEGADCSAAHENVRNFQDVLDRHRLNSVSDLLNDWFKLSQSCAGAAKCIHRVHSIFGALMKDEALNKSWSDGGLLKAVRENNVEAALDEIEQFAQVRFNLDLSRAIEKDDLCSSYSELSENYAVALKRLDTAERVEEDLRKELQERLDTAERVEEDLRKELQKKESVGRVLSTVGDPAGASDKDRTIALAKEVLQLKEDNAALSKGAESHQDAMRKAVQNALAEAERLASVKYAALEEAVRAEKKRYADFQDAYNSLSDTCLEWEENCRVAQNLYQSAQVDLGQLSGLRQKCAQLEDDLERAKKRHELKQKAYDELLGDKERLRENEQSVRRQIAETSRERAQLEESKRELQKKVQEMDDILINVKSDLDQKSLELLSANAQVLALTQQQDDLAKRASVLNSVEETKNQLSVQLARGEVLLSQKNETIEGLNQELKKAQDDLREALAEKTQLQNHLEAKRLELLKKELEIKQLTEANVADQEHLETLQKNISEAQNTLKKKEAEHSDMKKRWAAVVKQYEEEHLKSTDFKSRMDNQDEEYSRQKAEWSASEQHLRKEIQDLRLKLEGQQAGSLTLQKDLSEKETRLNELQTAMTKAQERESALKAKHAKKQETLKSQTKDIEKMKSEVFTLNEEKNLLEKDLDNLKNEQREKTQRFEKEMRGKDLLNKELQEQLEELKVKMKSARASYKNSQNDLSLAKKEKEDFEKELKKIQDSLAIKDKTYAELAKKLEEAKAEGAQAQHNLKILTKQLEEGEREQSKMKERLDLKDASLKKMSETVQALQKEKDKYKSELALRNAQDADKQKKHDSKVEETMISLEDAKKAAIESKESIKKLRQDLLDKDQEIQGLEKSLQLKTQELEGAQERQELQREQFQELQSQVNSLHTEHDRAIQEKETSLLELQEELQKMEVFHESNQASLRQANVERDKARKKLHQSEQNLQALQESKREADEKVQELMQSLEVEKNLTASLQKEKSAWTAEKSQISQNVEALQKRFQKLNTDLEEKQSMLLPLNQKVKEQGQRMQNLMQENSQICEQLRISQKELASLKQASERKLQELEEKAKSLEQSSKMAQKELQDAQRTSQDLKKVRGDLEVEKATSRTLTGDLTKQRESNEKATQNLLKKDQKLQELAEKVKMLEQSLQKAEKDLQDTQHVSHNFEMEALKNKNHLEDMSTSQKKLAAEKRGLSANVDKLKASIQTLEGSLQSARGELEETQRKCASAQMEKGVLLEWKANAQKLLEKAQSQITTMEAGQTDTLERIRALEENLTAKQEECDKLGLLHEDKEKSLKNLSANLKKLRGTLKEEEAKSKGLEDSVAKLKESNEKSTAMLVENVERVRGELEAAKTQSNTLKDELTKLEKDHGLKIAALNQKIEASKQAREASQVSLDAMKTEKDTLEAKLEKSNQRFQETDQDVRKLREQINTLSQEKKKLEKGLSKGQKSWEKGNAESTKKITALSEEVECLKMENSKKIKSLDAAQKHLKKLQEENEKLVAQNADMHSQLGVASLSRTSFEQMKSHADELKHKLEEKEALVVTAARELTDTKTRVSELEASLRDAFQKGEDLKATLYDKITALADQFGVNEEDAEFEAIRELLDYEEPEVFTANVKSVKPNDPEFKL